MAVRSLPGWTTARAPPRRWAEATRRAAVILPKARDPRFVTIRSTEPSPVRITGSSLFGRHRARSTSLTSSPPAQPEDPRPRQAIEHARAWVLAAVRMTQARAAAGHAIGPRPETCTGRHGMPRTLLARPWPWARTNSVRPPMRSRPHVLAPRRARARGSSVPVAACGHQDGQPGNHDGPGKSSLYYVH